MAYADDFPKDPHVGKLFRYCPDCELWQWMSLDKVCPGCYMAEILKEAGVVPPAFPTPESSHE